MKTIEDYWANESGAQWRTCRKPFNCHGLGGLNGKCSHRIEAGERYLDTHELTDWPNTYRICAGCASQPSKIPA